MKSSYASDYKIGEKVKTSKGEIVTVKEIVGTRYIVIEEKNITKQVYIPAHGELEKL